MDLSLRRHYDELQKEKAKEILDSWGIDYDERMIGIHAETPKVCSCALCGNPRRHFGEKTRQELIAEQREEYELQEFWMWWNSLSLDYSDFLELYPSLDPDYVDGMNLTSLISAG